MVLALSAHPRLLLLDESFDGIDPQKRLLMKGLLKEAINEYGMSVIISSHNLQELENLCDHIGIINGKKISVTGAVDDLSRGRTKFRLAFARSFDLKEFENIECEGLVRDGQLAMFTVNGDTVEILSVQTDIPMMSEGLIRSVLNTGDCRGASIGLCRLEPLAAMLKRLEFEPNGEGAYTVSVQSFLYGDCKCQ